MYRLLVLVTKGRHCIEVFFRAFQGHDRQHQPLLIVSSTPWSILDAELPSLKTDLKITC